MSEFTGFESRKTFQILIISTRTIYISLSSAYVLLRPWAESSAMFFEQKRRLFSALTSCVSVECDRLTGGFLEKVFSVM